MAGAVSALASAAVCGRVDRGKRPVVGGGMADCAVAHHEVTDG